MSADSRFRSVRPALLRLFLGGSLVIAFGLTWSVGCTGDRGGGSGQASAEGNQNANENQNASDNDAGNDTSAPGADYYVAPTGSDSDPGTEDQPWSTIQKAADTLVAGKTVYVRAGTYEERVILLNSGAPDDYITYSAYPGETVTIDGANLVIPEWGGLFDLTDREYIRVSRLRIMNAGPNPHNPGIQMDGASHILIENNYVYHTSDSGILVWNSNDVIVEGNEVEEACYGGFNEGISVGVTDGFEVRNNRVHHSQKEGICAKDGSSNGKVYGNEVYDTDAVGLYVDAQARYTHDIEVFDNIAHDIVEDGFAVASEVGGLLENVRLYNNLAYNNGWVGIDVSACCIDTHPMSNVQIVNNTLYNNGWDSWGGGIVVQNPQAQDVVVRNNICSENLLFQVAVNADLLEEHVIVDHNLIDGYRGGEDETYGDDYVEGEAGFADAAAADFQLQAGSLAIDGGSPTDAPATDFDGRPRPSGAGYDIGAYEYSSP